MHLGPVHQAVRVARNSGYQRSAAAATANAASGPEDWGSARIQEPVQALGCKQVQGSIGFSRCGTATLYTNNNAVYRLQLDRSMGVKFANAARGNSEAICVRASVSGQLFLDASGEKILKVERLVTQNR